MIAKCTTKLKDGLFPAWNVWQRDSSPALPFCRCHFYFFMIECVPNIKANTKSSIFWKVASDFWCFFPWNLSIRELEFGALKGLYAWTESNDYLHFIAFRYLQLRRNPNHLVRVCKAKNRKSPKEKYGENVALLPLNVWSVSLLSKMYLAFLEQ